MKTKLTFYGGVSEIGGNKILLEEGKTRIFLDMGQSFGFDEDFFTGYLGPRMSRVGLRDYFALNLVPKISGLYSNRMLEKTSFKYRPPRFQAIFLSHIHFDHSWHVQFIDPEIPVYLGEGTKIILDSWEEMSKSVRFGERDYRTFRTGNAIDVDGIEVRPIHVDHSVPAAYGYIIHTSAGTIAYTGDIRRHGPHSEMTDDFLEEAQEADILICEGTRVEPREKRKNYAESEVFSHSKSVVKKAKGKLVATTFYPRDVDRMKTFHRVAKETGRSFVVSANTARLLMNLARDPGIEVPDVIKDENILVYARDLLKRSGWQKELLDHSVNAEYVHRNQGRLILQLDFHHFTEFVDINPKPGSYFIHSMSEPFEEDDIEDKVKHNWLDHFKFHFRQYHASGHCSREEIFGILETIDARTVFPVHTEYPRMFKKAARGVVIPKLGKTYEL
ncbi:MAG: MBL fold metallo-hydrolase [Thermoplasmata archaeon]